MTFAKRTTRSALKQKSFSGTGRRHRNTFRGVNKMVVGNLKNRGAHFLRLCAVLVLIAGYFVSTVAVPIGLTPLAVTAGGSVGSVNLSEMEQINPFNGQLAFALPLLSIGGRGSVNHTITIPIQRRVQVLNIGLDGCQAGACPGFCETGGCGTVFSKHLSPVPTQNAFPGPVKLVGHRELAAFRDSSGLFYNFISSLSRFTLTMADGTELELRDKATDGKPFEWQGFQAPPGFPRGTEFVTRDGTSATFYSNDQIADRRPLTLSESPIPPYCGGQTHCITMTTPSGFVMMADGTRYDISQGRTTRMTDRNGNRIEFQHTTQQRHTGGQITLLTSIVDPLDRTVNISYGIVTGNPYDQITYKGVGNVDRHIKIYNQPLASTLISGTLPTLGQLYPELNPHDSFKDNPSVVARVELPNGKSYIFKYNSFGELARVELPTGGAIEYDFKNGVENGPANGLYGDLSAIPNSTQETFLYRRLIERRVFEGTNLIGFSTYSRSDTWNNNVFPTRSSPLPFIDEKSFDVQNSTCYANQSCQVLKIKRHYYFSSAAQSYAGSNLPSDFKRSRYPRWTDGREFKTEFLDTDGTTVLRKQEVTWDQSHTGWWTSINALEPPNNPRVAETKITINTSSGSLVSKTSSISPVDQSVGFDQFNNPTDVWEYDFGNGAPGPLIRHTHIDYVTDTAYTGSALTGNSHIRRLQSGIQIYAVDQNLNHTLVNSVETLYDQFPLTTYAQVTGWLDPGPKPRGNATSIRRWRDRTGTTPEVTNTWLEVKSEYDQVGNVIKTIDSLNNQNLTSFVDSYSDAPANRHTYANPTKGTSPIPEPTAGPGGPHASNTAFETTATYDYYTGLMTSLTDANGQTTIYSYGSSPQDQDPLDRLRQVIRASGDVAENQTTYTYDDDARTITTTTDVAAFNDNLNKIVSVYDSLGRTIETRTYENATDYITSKQEWDSLGRIKKTFNPFRTTSDSTYGWTVPTYDALSRIRTLQTFDGSGNSTGIVQTEYSGNMVSVTDQAGKRRLSRTDALGRLTDVWEITSADSWTTAVTFAGQGLNGYLTHYDYDVGDNLTKITQGSQPPRVFAYNSLKHLLQVTNPENGNTKYDYDANGNLKHKTDARGVVVTYNYDNLNRLITRSYSDGTPTVTYNYDLAAVPNSRGRITSTIAGDSNYEHKAFDALGRVTESRQTFTGPGVSDDYVMTYEYNKLGVLTSQKYPSGRIVKTDYDGAGRIAGVKNDATGAYYAGAAGSSADRIQYSPAGAIQIMKLGNDLWEHTNFNSASQVTQIGVGNSSTDSSKLKLDYTYGVVVNNNLDITKNNGNIQSQTITMPAAAAIVQTYTYDDLNRLKVAQEQGAAGWTQQFSYDQFGNRTGLTITDNPSFRLPSIAPEVDANNNRFKVTNSQSQPTGYEYDAAGNLTQEPEPAGTFLKYEYDGENRLKRAKRKIGVNEVTIAEYIYNGDGQRVRTVAGSTNTSYAYNYAGKLIAEYTNAAVSSSGTGYITRDMLGSTRLVTDSNKNVKERHDFLPHGEEINPVYSNRAAVAGFGIDKTRQKFTGKERDVETGLDFFAVRYYASRQGRFVSVDPLLASARPINPQTLNRYTYTLNNPLRFSDPTGLQEQDHSGQGKSDPCKRFKCQTDVHGDKFYVDANGDEVYVINAEQVIPNAERGFMTVDEARQQQAERRQSFIINNILSGVGYGIGRVFRGIGGIFRGRSSPPAVPKAPTAPPAPPARVALDANALIRGLDAGEIQAIDAALAGRSPVISITAAKEYLAKGDINVLRAFLQSRGGGIGAAATEADIRSLQAQAQVIGRVLSASDAAVAGSAMREGVPVMTRDQGFYNFLKAVGYPVEKF